MKKFLCIYLALSLIFSINIPFLNLHTQTNPVYAASLFETISDVITEVGDGVFNTLTAIDELGSDAVSAIVGTVVGNQLLNAGIITDSSTIQTIAEDIINQSGGVNLFEVVDGVLTMTSAGNKAVYNGLTTAAPTTGLLGTLRAGWWLGEFVTPVSGLSAPSGSNYSVAALAGSYSNYYANWYWSTWGGFTNVGNRNKGSYVLTGITSSGYWYGTFQAYYLDTDWRTYNNASQAAALTSVFGDGEYPCFGSVQGMKDYYYGSASYYGPKGKILDVSILSDNQIPITTVMNDSFNTLITNITENDYNYTDITTITNEYVTIINNFAPSEELTELLDYVVAIYNMLKLQFNTSLTFEEAEDLVALIPDGQTTYIVPSEISDQGSPSDFWSTLFSSRWAVLLLLFPLGLAAAAYVIFGK